MSGKRLRAAASFRATPVRAGSDFIKLTGSGASSDTQSCPGLPRTPRQLLGPIWINRSYKQTLVGINATLALTYSLCFSFPLLKMGIIRYLLHGGVVGICQCV